ncbi:MAG: Ig-like domain-containing protein [Ruminococcus sp.]|nr:Ig-like domain-containing protein [Ruminococcus sp.]
MKKIIAAIICCLCLAIPLSVSVAALAAKTDAAAAIAAAGSSDEEVTIPATRLRSSPQVMTLDIGETRQMSFLFTPKNSDDYLIPNSYNKNVAIADSDGLVTAVGPGHTTIRFKTSSRQKVSVDVTVNPPAASYASNGITLEDEFVKLRKGKTAQIYAFCYVDGKEADIKYISNDTKTATVDKDGLVTAVGTGETSVTITSGEYTAEYYVSVYSGVYKGVDVSSWQGKIDWSKVNDDGIDFAMIRSSYGTDNTDSRFYENVKGCEKNNIPYGIYHYTYAENIAEAETEALAMINIIKGTSPEYPIVLDIEESFYKSMSKTKVMNIIITFCNTLYRSGYKNLTIYSNTYFLTHHTNLEKLSANYGIWVASWGDEEKLTAFYDGEYNMWQYSSTGKVSGIDTDVDLNYSYVHMN